MDKLLEKDDYSVLKNSVVNEEGSMKTQRDGWNGMWKGVGDSIDGCLEEF